jgi:hypothetical protein
MDGVAGRGVTGRKRAGWGYDAAPAEQLGQRWRVAHISTAATTSSKRNIWWLRRLERAMYAGSTRETLVIPSANPLGNQQISLKERAQAQPAALSSG